MTHEVSNEVEPGPRKRIAYGRPASATNKPRGSMRLCYKVRLLKIAKGLLKMGE